MKALAAWDLARFKAESLPAARAYLKAAARPGRRAAGRRCPTIRSSPSSSPAGTASCGTTSSRPATSRRATRSRSSPPPRSGSHAAKSGPPALFVSMIPAIAGGDASSLRIRSPRRRPARDRGPAPPRRGARRQAARVARSDHRGPRARRPGDRRAVHLPRRRRRRDPPRPPGRPAVPRASRTGSRSGAESRSHASTASRGEKAPGLPYSTARFPARFDVCQRRAVPGSPPDASAPHPMPRGELRDRPSPTNPTDVACPDARRLHCSWLDPHGSRLRSRSHRPPSPRSLPSRRSWPSAPRRPRCRR